MLGAAVLAIAQCAAAPMLPESGGGWVTVTDTQATLVAMDDRHANPASPPPACHGFAAHQGEPNFGISDATAWLRFRWPAEVSNPRLLIRFGGLNHACMHWPLGDGSTRVDCRGDGRHSNGNETPLGLLFTPPAGLDLNRDLYLSAVSDLWLKVPLEFGSADGLALAEHEAQLGWGLFFGLLLGAALLGVVVFAGQGDRIYLYFSGHFVALATALALWQGRLVRFEPDDYSSIRLAPAMIGLFLASGAVFYRDFLATRRTMPAAFVLFRGISIAAALLAVISLALPALASSGLGLLALLWIAVATVTAIKRAFAGSRSARFVLAGLSILLLAILVNALQVIGFPILGARATNQFLYLGALSSAVFLMVAIAERIRGLSAERDSANQLLAEVEAQLGTHRARSSNRQGLGERLEAALRTDKLALRYQPLIDVREGAVLGTEALLRWPEYQEQEPITPVEIVEAAAEAGLDSRLTDWILRTALQQLVDWRSQNLALSHVSINLMAEEFHQPTLPDRVQSVLQAVGVNGACLRIEITEHTLVRDLDAAHRIIFALRNLGVGVWVDDFGAGYSSLNYLRSLPVSGLKLDRVFMQGFPHQPAAVKLVRAVLALGRDLGLGLVAEGIETAEQHELLKTEGDVAAQGFYYAHPLLADEYSVWHRQQYAPTEAALAVSS